MRSEVKLEDRLKILNILYPEYWQDLMSCENFDFGEQCDEMHIPKYRGDIHFVSQLKEMEEIYKNVKNKDE